VKQEPLEQEFASACAQAAAAATPYPTYSLPGVVSSSTHHSPAADLQHHHQQGGGGAALPSPPTPLPYSMGGPLPSLKSFAQQPKYLTKKKSGGDKSTDEYRRRRERNNVAVRKSREKAKMRSRETEERVKILARENDRLQKKVELLQEELSVLRSLFTSVGVLPDHVHRELAKHLDNFQAQHAAINY
jgi:CCAAT/enhancer binding protein (C/EBP)